MSTTHVGQFSTHRSSAATGELTTFDWRTVLMPLASLKLTVVLFALSMVLVMAGTLAQIDHDIWYVVHNYFRAWFAWMDFQVFFPRAWSVPGGIWFPGGWLVGAALGINLLAAHTLRFRVSAIGKRLKIGSLLLVFGMVLTWLVVQSGLDDTIESELSPAFCNGLWHALRFLLGASTLGLGYVLALNRQRMLASGASWLWWLATTTCVLLAVLSVWLFVNPEARLDPSGLRILWQLAKSTAAGLVLLAGCHYVFGRRAGIVLLHGGIALLMFSELWTGLQAQESQMRIAEGQTVSHAVDIREAEFALIDKSGDTEDRVTSVPVSMLVRAHQQHETLEDAALPFKLRVLDYQQNSEVRFLQPGEQTPATSGAGLLRIAEPRAISTGVGDAQGVDIPSIYVDLISNSDDKSLGTYLLSAELPFEEPIRIDGKPFEIALRFKQIPKPYAVKLIDFRFDRFVGTETPKNFSSEVELIDDTQSVDRRVTISMNNPLRYRGDTLYQADWDKATEAGTVLQVMTNSGWMIPYVSCMLVAIGMFAQFGNTFYRFTQRETVSVADRQRDTFRELLANWRSPKVWVPALVLVTFIGYVLGGARVRTEPVTEMQITEFGKLPVAYNGRVKPIDTMARNALTVLSGRSKLDDASASEWLLDLLSDSAAANSAKVLRIENLDVLQTLNLEPREGFRYSLAELRNSGDEYMRQWRLASEVPDERRNLMQKKFLELARKIVLVNTLQEAFSAPQIPTGSFEQMKAGFEQVSARIAQLNTTAPRPVPPATPGDPWKTMLEAERDVIFQRIQQKETNEATPALRSILDAYAAKDVQQFNALVADYREIVEQRAAADAGYQAELVAQGKAGQRKAAERLDLERVEFEAFFNHFNPFTKAMALYLVAFVLAACSWLGWNQVLNRSANWLLWFTFLLHTFALVCRIYISGRPPVTNLYSSAVFIGWAAVLFALVFERIYRFGIGNLLAAMVGFPTLFIAYNLAGDGDTFQVLQAVLDTQFWLATHVVCITLGYSTTLLAGVLGLVYVLMGHVANRLDEQQRQQLIRMTYGTICFATFFSFVGTVLGGLWADDSWGRFWGWDPKENGALLIVIWNALVLHARWGAMIRQRGLAVLAVFGNVVTAWSWFGVNQMGEGLHAYGFRKGMTFWLCVFVASQLLVMLLGYLPSDWWRGGSEKQPTPQGAS